MNEEKARAIKEAIKRNIEKKYPGDKTRQNKIIFGTLRKQGWKPKRERES